MAKIHDESEELSTNRCGHPEEVFVEVDGSWSTGTLLPSSSILQQVTYSNVYYGKRIVLVGIDG